MPADLECWRHVADANGGFSLCGEEPQVVTRLTTALRVTAASEADLFADAELASIDGSYRSELLGLLQVLAQ